MRQASRSRPMRSLQPHPAKAPPHRRSRRALRRSAIDPVDAAIILGAFETICYEMATHVSLTATTPILNQSNERNATILDGTGQLAALSVGIPQFMLSSTLPVRFAVEFFGDGGLFEGDVLVANDPYHGGGHLPDYNIFAPVFHDGACVLIASIQCHHADTGGGAPGGYNVNAPDIWAEGVRFPAVKLIEKGVKRRDVEYMMAANSRTPTFLGDLRAQVGAAELGARRRFREEVQRWPDGVYESDVYVDHDPHGKRDIHVHCAATERGSALTIDFTGSDDRPDIQAYSTFGNTRGYVVAQLASMMDPSIPKNEGFFDAIELIVPKGCCLNPPEGKSVAAGTHHPGTEVGEAIAKALERVVPERTCPQIYKMGMPTVIFGTDPRDGKVFIDHSVDSFAAYCGAVRGQDGWGAMNVSFGNLIRATAEINEAIFPVRQLARDYETDTGGAGEFRGNCGSLYRKQVLVPATVYTYVVGKRYPMPGIAGGRPGSPNRLVVRAGGAHAFEVGERAEYIEHGAGEWYEYHYGGGGGWGDPLERPADRVLDDVLDEYVSVGAAGRDYGVVLTGALADLTLAIDREATEQLRAAMRAARKP